MSASEKLKALEAKVGSYPKSMTTTGSLLHALPHIVAVVEAAERGERFSSKDLDRSHGGWNDSWMETDALDVALSALEEALS